jgi:hypothetical protein
MWYPTVSPNSVLFLQFKQLTNIQDHSSSSVVLSPRTILFSRKQLMVSGDVFGCLNWNKSSRHIVGLRETTQYSLIHRTAFHKNLPLGPRFSARGSC